MAIRALGLIEIKGYLGAVVAADAALKAANVSLINIEKIRSGLNTVQLVGDVSAVKSAVDAAVALVQDEPYYLASHVIPRLDEQTEILFKSRKKNPVEEESEVPVVEEVVVATEILESESVAEVVSEEAQAIRENVEKNVETASKYNRQELEKLKVVKLRSLAYREKDIRLSKKEIKFANKRLLIQALMEITGKES